MYKEHTRLDLVEGGNVFKQGDELTLAFKPRDEKGRVIDLAGKTIEGAIFSIKTGVIYEAPATWNASDQTIEFKIDELLDHGRFEIEFTATSTGYRLKIPSSGNNATLQIKPSTDDIDYVGVSKTTVTQLRQEQEAQQQQFEGVIVPKVNQIETQFNEVLNGATADGEVQAARIGPDATYSTIGQRMDATAAQLVETGELLEDVAINVTSFGAVGNGVTDNTEPIQTAINYANANKKVLMFPDKPNKVYIISDTLIIPTGLKINGNNSVLKMKTTGAYKPALSSNVPVQNLGIRDLIVDGNKEENTSSQVVKYSGIYFDGISNSVFQNVEVRNVKDLTTGYGNGAIHVRGAINNIFSDCIIKDNQKEGLQILGGAWSGSLGSNSYNNKIVDCTITGNGLSGISIVGQANNNLISGNYVCDNVTTNISVNGYANVVNGNIANGSVGAHGIVLGHDSETNASPQCVVTNNICQNNANAGVSGARSDYAIVSNNFLKDNAINGIFLSASQSVNIQGNTIVGGCSSGGIVLDAGTSETAITSENNIISGNNVQKVLREGIRVSSVKNSKINGNLIVNCNESVAANDQGSGIRVLRTNLIASTHNAITDNLIVDDRSTPKMQYGIYFESNQSNMTPVNNNIIKGAANTPIYAQATSNNGFNIYNEKPEFLQPNRGFIMKSTNGSRYEIRVTDSATLSVIAVP